MQGEIQPDVEGITFEETLPPNAFDLLPFPFDYMRGHRQFETHSPGGNTRFDLRRTHYSSSDSGSDPPPPPDDPGASGVQRIEYSSDDSSTGRPPSAPNRLRRSYAQARLYGTLPRNFSDEEAGPS